MERTPAWARLGAGAAVLLLAVAAVVFASRFGLLWSRGVIDLQPWFHPIPPRGAWIPFIHPPGYSEFMFQAAALSERLWVAEGYLVFLIAGGVSALLIVGLAIEVGGRWGPGWAVYVGLLVLFSPASLRPFEHYPPSKVLATAAILLFLRWTRTGARAAAVGSFATAMAVFSLHLSAWFVVGPSLAVGALLAGDRRRPAVAFVGGLIAAFLVFGAMGTTTLYEVLSSTGAAENQSVSRLGWANLTYEWNNPWLWAPLALWFVPAIRDGRRDGVALAVGMAAFALVHFGLMHQALIIGGDIVSSHHYFELIDGLACFAAVAALGAGWKHAVAAPGKVAVAAAAVVLGAVHVRRWLAGIEKLEELARYPG